MSTRRRKEVYRKGTTAWKALLTWMETVFGAGVLAKVMEVELPATVEGFMAEWPMLLLTLAPPAATAIENWRKNYRDDGRVLWSWPVFIDKIHRPGMPIVLAMLLCAGCVSNLSTATMAPDGTKTLRQQTFVTLGAKLTEGQLAFSAENVGADGSNWAVSSGTGTKGADTPEITTLLIQAILAAQVQRAVIDASKPPEPSQIEVLLEGLRSIMSAEQAARDRLPSDY